MDNFTPSTAGQEEQQAPNQPSLTECKYRGLAEIKHDLDIDPKQHEESSMAEILKGRRKGRGYPASFSQQIESSQKYMDWYLDSGSGFLVLENPCNHPSDQSDWGLITAQLGKTMSARNLVLFFSAMPNKNGNFQHKRLLRSLTAQLVSLLEERLFPLAPSWNIPDVRSMGPSKLCRLFMALLPNLPRDFPGQNLFIVIHGLNAVRERKDIIELLLDIGRGAYKDIKILLTPLVPVELVAEREGWPIALSIDADDNMFDGNLRVRIGKSQKHKVRS
jgi:hypothetical protein